MFLLHFLLYRSNVIQDIPWKNIIKLQSLLALNTSLMWWTTARTMKHNYSMKKDDKVVQDRPHWINTVTLFFDIYAVFWWFLVNMKVLIPNPPGARRETVSIFHNMQIIQNGRHDVIDLHISLVFWHKQIYLMAGSQTWNLEYFLKYQIIQNGRHDVIVFFNLS